MSDEGRTLRVAQVVPSTEAEGPGRRFALWVQGCRLRCSGCCNPEMFSAGGGVAVEVDALLEQVLAQPDLEGVSVLGGEPFEQALGVARFCQEASRAGLSVMVFTGYTHGELLAMDTPAVADLLAATDLLVDGRYDRARPEQRRRWVGSENQVLHFLTPRYRPDDGRFLAPNTVELRFARGTLLVNGWPLAKGVGP